MNDVQKFNGARLKLARTFFDYTLADLGERTGVTRQYIQRLETDANVSPAEDMLHALAELLHVDPQFFFRPLNLLLDESNCHFRKRKTTPKHLHLAAIAYGNTFYEVVRFVQKYAKLPGINFPSFPKPLSRNDIERAAENSRLHWGLGLDTPIKNMVRVVENFGGVVTTFKGLSEKIDAFSYVYYEDQITSPDCEENGRPIVVRSDYKNSTSRARFDVAHEVGHLILHKEEESDNSDLENEADYFAGAFLLPRSAFLREFPMNGDRISWTRLFDFKKRWGVSLQAIIRRAYDLGKISAVNYRNANIYISRKGWRSAEPLEGVIPVEYPEIMGKALALIHDRKGLGLLDISSVLLISPVMLNQFEFADSEQTKRLLTAD